jgi:hypothetical protein
MSKCEGWLHALGIVAGLGILTPQVFAQAKPAALDLSLLMSRFSAIKTARAHFSEQRYLHMLKAPLGDSGVLIYLAPDKLQKITQLPHPENLTIEGDTLTMEREGKTQTFSLTNYPQVGGFIEGIRSTLAGDLATLQRIYDTRLEGSIDAWELQLQPRSAATQAIVRSIDIAGSDAHIKRIETLEHDGDRAEMIIVEDGR